MKIMRRTEGSGEDQPPSSRSSKAASEVEDEGSKPLSVTSPTDSTTARDKPAITREEREAKYREARERIFGDYKESEKADMTDDGTVSSSRASSTTSRKKKKNRNHDDAFDSRSAYNLYYPASQRSAPFYDQPTNQMGYYAPYMSQGGAPMIQFAYQQPYPQYPQMSPMGQMPGYQYPAPHYQMMQMPAMYGAPGHQPQYPQYPQQPRSPYFAAGAQVTGASNSMSSPAMSNHSSHSPRSPSQQMEQPWPQSAYGYPYNNMHGTPNNYQPAPHIPNQTQQSTPPAGYSMPSVPYAYGQLPYQPNGQASRPIHPIPGSYNRQHFNPHSKVFVPGQGPGAEMALGPSSGNAAPQHREGVTPPSQQSPRKTPAPSQSANSPAQDTISKWAAPATLPPKPPPPASESAPPSSESVGSPERNRNGNITRPHHHS
jgi:SUZ domain